MGSTHGKSAVLPLTGELEELLCPHFDVKFDQLPPRRFVQALEHYHGIKLTAVEFRCAYWALRHDKCWWFLCV